MTERTERSVEPPARPARRAYPFRVIALGLLALVGLAVGTGLFIYWRYVRYERVAALHVPADSRAAVRLDVEKVVFFEPVRAHVLPFFDRWQADPRLRSRLKRIQGRTGLELGVDLRELAVAVGPAPGDWVVVAGGLFSKKKLLEGIRDALNEEHLGEPPKQAAARWRLEAGTLVADRGSPVLGQAEDGVLIVASSAARLSAALKGPSLPDLDQSGAGGFVLDTAGLLGQAPLAAPLAAPGLLTLRRIQRVTGAFELGPSVGVQARARVLPGEPAEQLVPAVKELVRAAPVWAGLVAPGLGAGLGPLRHTEVAARGTDEILLTVQWPRDRLGQLIEAVVALIGAADRHP